MKTTIQTEVMTFDELSEKAKQKARAWYLEGNELSYAWEDTREDAKNIGLKITELRQCRSTCNKGEFIDGAFNCANKILAQHGEACETFRTAKRYFDHIFLAPKTLEEEEENEVMAHDFLHSLLENYRIMFNKDVECQQSDEVVDDTIMANEYTFTADGKRFG